MGIIEIALAFLLYPDICQLGHDDWTVREAAHRRLEAHIQLSWPSVSLAGYWHKTQHNCPEVRNRVRKLMRKAGATTSHWTSPVSWIIRGIPGIKLIDPYVRETLNTWVPLKWAEGYEP